MTTTAKMQTGNAERSSSGATARRSARTVSRRGHRVAVPVAPGDGRLTSAQFYALVKPFRDLMRGGAVLEPIERARMAEARELFGKLLVRRNHRPELHTGLANACILEYEWTRSDPAPDAALLQCAVEHAQTACQLNPHSGEPWATYGFVLERAGDRLDAVAALLRATYLWPDNWCHQFRLAAASWGQRRLDAAWRTLALQPDCLPARLLAAMVYVARGVPARAEEEVDAGLAWVPGAGVSSRFSPVGLHWLKGLLRLARGADEAALAAFARELALEPRCYLYARECHANAWYAIGACHLRRGDHPAAHIAFEQAIARVPTHRMAHVGLRLLTGERRVDPPSGTPLSVDDAVARAAVLVADGDTPAAVRVLDLALEGTQHDAGWLIPIEPLLGVARDRSAWMPVPARLSIRAC